MENQIIFPNVNQGKMKEYEQVQVMRVIDGNSFIASDGRIIRLVGVDTPECFKNKEKFERLAKKFTTEWLLGETVWLERDISDVDCYSRYLRIVWMRKPFDDRSLSEIEACMANIHILIEGYAKAAAYPPDVKYHNLFRFIEAGAKSRKMGIWGI